MAGSNYDPHYHAINEQYGRLISYSIPCEGVTLSQFLKHARGSSRFYWETSHSDVAFAGMGTAVELFAYVDRFDTIARRARELFTGAAVLDEREPLAAPRLFGGFSFRDDFIPDNTWSDFTPAHFVLPHYQLVRVEDRYRLTINAHISLDEDPHLLVDDLHAALIAKITQLQQIQPADEQQPALRALEYPVSLADWTQQLNDAIERMRRGELEKVVLSRVAEAQFAGMVNVDLALDYLARTYPDTYRFLFEPRAHHAFYGATPELLVQVTGTQLKTMALAGSIRRGQSAAEDETLAAELLASQKNRYEHQLVADEIERRLQPLTDTLHTDTTDIMRLSNIQHLHTPITGTLKRASGVLPLVRALHPTPALGGSPSALAMDIIRQTEAVPRGWFAAPVGWIDRDLNGQFSVAIRSAVAQDKRVWMYAGAGIVADSEPRAEWDETALKFTPMMRALNIQNATAGA